jgi:DNA-directed RNA polymerase subunit beta'
MSKSVKEYLISPKYADNSIVIMANSGARGNLSQLMQMVGMRGLMAKSYDYSRKNVNQIPRDTIENPVLASFREGMNINEFFNSSFGARKAISDVQMKTSKSGYMTRKLVDACQEVVVREDDCGSTSGIIYSDILDNDGKIIKDVLNRIIGRYAAIDIVDKDDKVIVQANELITEILANKIAKAKITNVEVRSPIYCQCKNGICKKCYGLDITTNKDPEIGTPVGIIAAQSIGEPITQINLRSFHSGGVAGGPQIAQGYERIVQLLELIQPQTYELARISSINGKITAIDIDVINERKLITISNTKNNDIEQISLDLNALLLNGIEVGATITRGQKLNFGSYSLKELLSICGIEAVRRYIIEEVQKVYLAQGININDKYVEIIVMQITNKLLVTNLNDADIIPGELLTTKKIIELNNNLFNQNKKLINAIPCLVALPNIPTYSTSFLASASFQYTKKALVKAALRGQVDNLENIKENVMLGCLIPAGTSLKTNDDLIDDAKKVVCEEYE